MSSEMSSDEASTFSSHAARGPYRRATTATPLSLVAGGDTFDSGQPSIEYAVSVPENYTPSYAYPLIVWFHDDGRNESDVRHWVPRISPQNYLGLGLRAPIPMLDDIPENYRWSAGDEHVHWLEDDLSVALQSVCESLSIHPERIVTAGVGRGGTMALRMLLRRPDWFAGAAALNATMPTRWRLDCWGQYRRRSLWLGQSDCHRAPAGRCAFQAARSLHAAGMDVTRRYYTADYWPVKSFVCEVDQWLMHTLCGATVIS